MRRFTLITLIVLLLLLLVAGILQLRAANGPRRFPGPGTSGGTTPTLSVASP